MRSLIAPAVFALLLLPSTAGLAQSGKTREAWFSLVPDKEQKVGIKSGPITIETVRIRNWPDADDFQDAEKDLNETHTMWLEFTYSNRDEVRDYKCLYVVTVPGPDGAVAGQNDRKATLDKGKLHDTNKVSLKMKTRYYKKLKSFRVTFDIWPD
ncbi:MAG: hypothetical protein L6R30_06570 [Thermoanaerobaculia bacterium]|nr:hypothetical protein [Thermoanaerobaculia bacterium]